MRRSPRKIFAFVFLLSFLFLSVGALCHTHASSLPDHEECCLCVAVHQLGTGIKHKALGAIAPLFSKSEIPPPVIIQYSFQFASTLRSRAPPQA